MTLSPAQQKQIEQLAAKRRAETEERQPAPKPWKPRKVHPRLHQQENGEWVIYLASGCPMQATDAEVALWKALQEALAELEDARAMIRKLSEK
jgi:hypothetical protein